MKVVEKMNKKEVKKIIELYEENNNGIRSINGAYIDVSNIKILKDKVIATIELVYQMDGKSEKYTGCEYPISLFKKEGKE